MKIGEKRTSGVLLHVTSLPGPHGIGDLGPSAYHFVDWLESAGQSLWQWLPTAHPGVSYSPYAAVSCMASSPLMVALEPLAERGWLTIPDPTPEGFGDDRVDYPKVTAFRMACLRAAAKAFFSSPPAEQEELDAWCEREKGWLADYALFMALDEEHRGEEWWKWPVDIARREPAAMRAAHARHAEEIRFWCFVQWCFDWQCRALLAYANSKGVHVVGDIPIYVAEHSADLWARPDLFLLDERFERTHVGGCPPDPLVPEGQRWGNPLYRWSRMKEDGYAWRVQRISRVLAYSNLCRIDHFRAFASYWSVPFDAPSAADGRWEVGPGLALFDALRAKLGEVPVIAEDLAYIVTQDIHDLRDACGFPGMRVLMYGLYGDPTSDHIPHNYRRDVVAYTGTHDNDTARGFWSSASPQMRAFASAYLSCDESDVHWEMIRAVFNSIADTAIVPLQDVLGLDETHRMNVVGTVMASNWSWRFSWAMIPPERARELARITAASGRCAFSFVGS